MEHRSAADFIPDEFDLPRLREAAAGCTGCELYRNASQTVFGEGPERASVVLIGEQPGDREDRSGHPFIGPAGALLNQALEAAGFERGQTYVTNAVKHFKWEAQGKRRLHKKPSEREIDACTPWLLAELTAIRPQAVVCLGATATRAAFGHRVRMSDLRGRFEPTRLSQNTFITLHPSAILRLKGTGPWEGEYRRFVSELSQVRARLSGSP